MKTLDQVTLGESVRVKGVHAEGILRRRLRDMGLTKGAQVTLRKLAPLGDPMELTVRGYELSLRKKDAACVEVE
ncbi:FeoA family protein [Aerococcus sanguinicola]|uniref:Ferrous iron transport protein A n=1 Tax=Aerococcus sanguinicola TaxID=119206 RepID=A0A0X8FBT0_9LACT|nr:MULTISPECIES: FeoA family protein [Aerococcus]AMB94377.1 iron transporter FeoA [Aerococcus sanguinicola]MDK6804998.1 FeoA family protein [Aerococcus sp. UMB7834]MDK7049835.1 FeoA family protein [Aerococcus sanguinicola]MDK8501885.1 FeoA family protein [Aerococcus sp. UMB1112A]OFT93456.1 iron transporter FeoA [Aerococcus sp. HMSC23C02]